MHSKSSLLDCSTQIGFKLDLLTNPFVGVDGGVSGSARQILAIPVGNVLAIRVLVLFGQSEVNDEDRVLRLLVAANEEVIRFDIPVDYALLMHLLNKLHLRKESLPKGMNTIYMATRSVVLRSNSRLQDWKRSSRLGPS